MRLIWNRDFTIHTISYFLMAVSFYFLLPTLPLYVVNNLGESNTQVGYIIGIYALSALIVRPFSGYAFDVFGRRATYIFSLLSYALIIAGYFLSFTFFILLVIRFLHGLSWGMTTTGGATIASDLVPEGKRGEGIGFFGLSFSFAMALAPVIGFEILDKSNFNGLFAAALLIALLSFTLSNLVRYPDIRRVNTPFSFNSFIEKKILNLCLVMLIAAISYAGIFSFITLYGQDIGIENSGSFFLVYAVGVGLFRPVSGRIMDRYGPWSMILTSFVLSISGLWVLTYTTTFSQFMILGFIIGTGHGIIMPVLMAMMINMVKPENRGIANATFFSAVDLGIGIGSILLGYLAEFTSLAYMYRFCAVILIIPLVYFYFVVLKDYYRKIGFSGS